MTTSTKSGKVPPGQEKKIQGTIIPVEPFDMKADVAALQKAICTSSCDAILIDMLPKRGNNQRQEIREGYKTATGRELIDDLNAKLPSGKFKDVVTGLLHDNLEFQARCLYQSMKGMGTDEKGLVDVLCTKNRNVEIQAIKETYTEMFKRQLDSDIAEDTSGFFMTLLITLAKAAREEAPSYDIEKQARIDADALFMAGEGRKSGPRDDNKFIEILANRSFIQLNLATFKFYDQKSKKGGIEKAILAEGCGDFDLGLVALVMTAKGELIPFFVERLYNSMKGMGTDDSMLIRTLISRSEIDLANIRDEFQVKQGSSLVDFITDDTSQSYRDILVRIVQGSAPTTA